MSALDRQSSWKTLQLRVEVCEPRLVLSAQVLFDVLGDQAIQIQHPLDHVPYGPLPQPTIPIAPALHEAHAQSGWNTAQQEFGLRGSGQTVAVIDSGIAWDHVALGKGLGPGYRVVGGWDFAENDARPYDDGPIGFHGTHVAGIIGSADSKHSGVASEVDLVALRVFNDTGKGQLEWVERALQWVHNNRNTFENPITTVNLSLGTSWNSDNIPNWGMLEDELRQLYNDGIVVTASAGNSFKSFNVPGLSYPANSQFVLPVASVDDNGQLSDFSQRHERVLAAPGRNIISTVPDHVLGRDGKIDDFSTASGTSMASPYVAGASVLVREAMQMVSFAQINAQTIIDHLHNTADTIFDSITKASYDRLNIQKAIDALIPDDAVGDVLARAQTLSLNQASHTGWINHLGDADSYRFTTDAAGQFHLDVNSKWLDNLRWNLATDGHSVASGDLTAQSLQLESNRTYELRFAANKEIGPFDFQWSFTAQPAPVIPSPAPAPTPNPGPLPAPSPVPTPSPMPPEPALSLGTVDYVELNASQGKAYQFLAARDGTLSVQWNNPDIQTGALVLRGPNGQLLTDRTWDDNSLRVDLQVTAGQRFEVQLPSTVTGDQGQLAIANVISANGKTLNVNGTAGSDTLKFDLQRSGEITFGSVRYVAASGQYTQVHINTLGGNDSIQVMGSTDVDKVDLKPGVSTIANSRISATLAGVEQISFLGGGGADRVYLYDANTDDSLTMRPRYADLKGQGYRFTVENVERLYVHANSGGHDVAHLYDSDGNDRLSVRPQFTSMSGTGYFNYLRGFDRVYAYASAGFDQADLYDSSGNDRFLTSRESASIVGSGFSSYTRFFEQVNAYATSGGIDTATLYVSNSQSQWQRAVDSVNFQEAQWSRQARGFENAQTIVGVPSSEIFPQRVVESQAIANLTQTSEVMACEPQSSPAIMTTISQFSTDTISDREVFGKPPQDAIQLVAPAREVLLADVLDTQSWLREKTDSRHELSWESPSDEAGALQQVFEQFGRE